MSAPTRALPVRAALALSLALGAAPLAALESDGAAGAFRTAPRPVPEGAGRWRLTVEGEGVGDTVPHAPNAAGGGFEPARERPRYAAVALGLERRSGAWHAGVELRGRRLVSLRDSYTIGGVGLGLARRLPAPVRGLDLELTLDVDANGADELYKNSWTEIDGARLTGARVHGARDVALTLGLAARVRLARATHLVARVGIGTTHATHARVSGEGTDADGCRYAFEASSYGGALELLEPCGSMIEFDETYADEAGVRERLGFAPTTDLKTFAPDAGAGATLVHRAGRLELAVGYAYRRRDRGAFDARIQERGGRTVASSHTTSLRVGYAVSRALALRAGVHYRSTAYLDELPLLYNAFTSERFLRDTLAFGAGVALSF